MKQIVLAYGATVVMGAAAWAQIQGPSTAEVPYAVPVAPGVQTLSLLTVGESVNLQPDGQTPYRLVGIPDGLGAVANGDGSFTLLVNHELSDTVGVVRAHGARGAFVSKWVIDTTSLAVLSGEDLIQQVSVWNISSGAYEQSFDERFDRFCSGDLPLAGAFFNEATGLGTQELLYTNGEETGSNGRAFVHVISGPDAGHSYELARCGNLGFENIVASPTPADTTVLIGLDDSSIGQLYIYVGQKTDSGNDIDRAGLTNGSLYGVVVAGLPSENSANGLGGPSSLPFTLYDFGDVSALSGAALQDESVANGVTAFRRPEDGHFDPLSGNDFYWATTGVGSAPGRLWRLRFADVRDPTLGGTIDLLLDGTEGVMNLDNLTVDHAGHVLIQEDRGSSSALSRIWLYDIASDTVLEIARMNPDFFAAGGDDFLTTNDESSGIIDAGDLLGDGWFLLDVQAHYSIPDSELVQGGQLLAMFVPQTLDCPTTGSCCLPGGGCLELDETCCTELGGTPFEERCSAPESCCLPSGACQSLDPVCCAAQGGTPSGGSCTAVGSCCLADGGCLDLDPQCCAAQGGTFTPGACGNIESCCLEDGTCQDLDPQCCAVAGGTLTSGLCGNIASCCLPEAGCVELDSECCTAQGGTSISGTCEPEPCCLPDGTCGDAAPGCCTLQEGVPGAAGESCTAAGPCCLPDNSCVQLDPLCCATLAGNPLAAGEGCSIAVACCIAGECIEMDPLCCEQQGGALAGPGCLGDISGDGVDDACVVAVAVPALSRPSMVVLVGLFMGALALAWYQGGSSSRDKRATD